MLKTVGWVLLSLGLFLTASVHATPVPIQSEKLDGISVGHHLLLFEDKDGTLQFQDVLELPDSAFSATKEAVPNFSFTRSAYWARLTIDNQLQRAASFIVEYGYPIADTIDFYSMDAEGNWFKQESGDKRPTTQRILPHRLAAFPCTSRKDGRTS